MTLSRAGDCTVRREQVGIYMPGAGRCKCNETQCFPVILYDIYTWNLKRNLKALLFAEFDLPVQSFVPSVLILIFILTYWYTRRNACYLGNHAWYISLQKGKLQRTSQNPFEKWQAIIKKSRLETSLLPWFMKFHVSTGSNKICVFLQDNRSFAKRLGISAITQSLLKRHFEFACTSRV